MFCTKCGAPLSVPLKAPENPEQQEYQERQAPVVAGKHKRKVLLISLAAAVVAADPSVRVTEAPAGSK